MKKLGKKKIVIIGVVLLVIIISVIIACVSCGLGKNNSKSSYNGIPGDESGSNGTPLNTENSTNIKESIELKEDEVENILVVTNESETYDSDARIVVSNSDNTIMLNGTAITYTGTGVTINGSEITITEKGEYVLVGTLDDGRIIVDADKDADITIILAGANISNSKNACIYVKSADKVIVNLAEGTENTLSDAEEYTYDDETEEEPNAAVFSKDDLVIAGNGSLKVNGNFNNGIVSKDDLRITGGNITVNAVNNGLKGKDALIISNASVTVDAMQDGLKADNADEEGKGYIYIEESSLNITSGEDGIQAENDIEITSGTFVINTGEGSKVTSSGNNDWGFPGWGDMNNTTTTDTVSIKAIKSTGSIYINGGTFAIDSEDDCIHANTNITINAGTFELASGDDGMHADTDLTINDGDIKITKSYEGIEATNIYICGGTIDVVSSDDGLNAAGGNDNSAMGRPGMGGFSGSSGSIEFNGGSLTMDASGDGVDSNGTVVFNGGKVVVYGPTNSGNGTFDFQSSWTQNGGSLIGIGSSGMAQMPGNASSQNSVMITFTTNYGDGDVVTIKNSSGDVVMQIEGKKAFNNVVFSNSALEKGETYTIYVNDEKYDDFTISTVCTTIGSAGGMGGPGGGMGGPGMGGAGDGGRPGWR